ncbi:MAG TPA: WhiB family transcriptional regulator [Streptosporangiaceae bacterium]|nr:WhiB family transcriptional regulator [Streptosporangiaceae bacterium]
MDSAASHGTGLGWLALGACRDKDPDLFFPVGSTGPAIAQVAAAKAVCARCNVRAACLRFALEKGQDHGVWGGTTEEERRAIRRGRRGQAEQFAS